MSYILINLVGIFGAFGLSRAIYRREKTLVTFANVFSFFWGTSLLVNMTYAGGLIRVSASTLLVLYAAWLALLFGALIILRSPRRAVHARVEVDRKRAFYVLGFLLAANACAIYFDVGMDVAIHSTSLDELMNQLALARINGELLGTSPPLFLGIFRYAFVLYVPLLAMMWRKKWIKTSWFVVTCIASGAACLTHFTRAPLVQLLVILFFSLIVVFPRRSSKFLIWGTLLAVVVVGGFVSMEALLSGANRGAADTLDDSLVSYCGGPMKAYDLLLHGQYPAERGLYSADMVNYPLYRMGLIRSYPSLVREEVLVPFETNVYTFLDAFTLDFGALGAILGAFGIGVFVASVYRAASPTSYWGTVVYCLVTYYLVMAVLNNEFIRFNFPVYVLLAWLVQVVICPLGKRHLVTGVEVLHVARVVRRQGLS